MEVIARIKAILRRQRIMENAHQQNSAYDYGYSLSSGIGNVNREGQPIDCTAKELELLQFFCKHPNHIFTTAQLYELVWGMMCTGKKNGHDPYLQAAKNSAMIPENPKSS